MWYLNLWIGKKASGKFNKSELAVIWYFRISDYETAHFSIFRGSHFRWFEIWFDVGSLYEVIVIFKYFGIVLILSGRKTIFIVENQLNQLKLDFWYFYFPEKGIYLGPCFGIYKKPYKNQ